MDVVGRLVSDVLRAAAGSHGMEIRKVWKAFSPVVCFNSATR
jgi:hypothetical protein